MQILRQRSQKHPGNSRCIHWRVGLIGVLLLILLAACDMFSPKPANTPIFVTATPEFIIVTNTFTPSPSPVLAPTLNLEAGQTASVETTEVANNPSPTPPSPTATTILTVTPSFTPTPTNTRTIDGVPPFLPVGVGPDDPLPDSVIFQVPGGCAFAPQGGFATIYNNNPSLAAQVGCATNAPITALSAYQPFERGAMIWVSIQGTIYVLFASNNFQAVADTWQDGIDPSSLGLQPPTPNLLEPIRGFGKVWRDTAGVQNRLGWATSQESGGQMTVQQFERGLFVYLSQNNQTYVLIAGNPGTWTAVSVAY